MHAQLRSDEAALVSTSGEVLPRTLARAASSATGLPGNAKPALPPTGA